MKEVTVFLMTFALVFLLVSCETADENLDQEPVIHRIVKRDCYSEAQNRRRDEDNRRRNYQQQQRDRDRNENRRRQDWERNFRDWQSRCRF
uniref:Secreted protein n=1 Tax=Romanomermis culicivorax TaxID=13658 RepID=A0A915JFN1_ROMCU